MPKFDVNRYFTAVWDAKVSLIGTTPNSSAKVMCTVIETLSGSTERGSSSSPLATAAAEIVAIDTKCSSSKGAETIQRYMGAAGQLPSSIYVVILGETHRDMTDTTRNKGVANALGVSPLQVSLVLIEKALSSNYPTPNVDASMVVDEAGIIPTIGLSIKQRSVVTAAYLILCLLGSSEQEKIALFFGEEHKDIFQYLEFFIAKCNAAKGLAARPRHYQLLRSYRTKAENFKEIGTTGNYIKKGTHKNFSPWTREEL